jgi:alkylhydroperoxidase/carboxymuconolactone decarboxylase family protein YurZ
LSGYGNLVSQWLEVLIQKAFYAGVPAVSSAFQIAKEAFAEAGL